MNVSTALTQPTFSTLRMQSTNGTRPVRAQGSNANHHHIILGTRHQQIHGDYTPSYPIDQTQVPENVPPSTGLSSHAQFSRLHTGLSTETAWHDVFSVPR